ncbi:hypothetical protein ACHAWF_010871 [Thalassiosira exigua]
MTFASWTKFCDELDEALKPATKLRKCVLGYFMVFGFLAVGMVIFSFVSFSRTSTSFDFDSTSSPFLSFLPILIVFLLLMVGMFGTMCFAARTTGRVNDGLRKVCEDTTARYPGISFHVRYETHYWHNYNTLGSDNNVHHHNVRRETINYIEVNVSGDTENATPAVGYVAPLAPVIAVPSAPVMTAAVALSEPEVKLGAGARTPAQRMGELDEMRGLLSEDEYHRKRAEIMSDV